MTTALISRLSTCKRFYGFAGPTFRRFAAMGFVAVAMLTTQVQAQVDVTATVNVPAGSYGTLKLAFDAINAGTHRGVITIGISGNTSETVQASLNASGSGSASYTSIAISPTGGAARTISGSQSLSAVVDFNGADNITIDGLNSSGNALTITNTNTNNGNNTSTIRLREGATNNTITRCTIRGSSLVTTGSPGGTIHFSITGSVGNSNNTISFNNIGPAGSNLPIKAISGIGTNSSAATQNSGNLIDNNNIFDFFNATNAVSGIYVGTGNTNWTISNNRIYQTAARTFTTTAIRYAGITVAAATGAPAQFHTISDNIIGFGAADGTGTTTLTGSSNEFRGIALTASSTTTFCTVSNNTISGINQTSSRASTATDLAPFIGIQSGSSATDAPANMTGNTIGSLDGSSTIVINATSTTAGSAPVQGILDFNFGTGLNVNNNNIGSITIQSTGTTVGFRGILIAGTTGTTHTVNNNTVANITNNLVGNNANYGIQAGSTSINASGNTIRNMTTNGAGTAGTIVNAGIVASASTVVNTWSQNTVHSLHNNSGATGNAVFGLFCSFPTAANVVERNLVHSLSMTSSVTTGVIVGIAHQLGSGTTYRNNMARLGYAANGTSITTGYQIIGMRDISTASSNFYHNSVYVGGTGVVSAVNTYAFLSTSTGGTRDYRNNIFYNGRSNASGGIANLAIAVGGTAPNPAGLTSNYNVIRADGTDGVAGIFNAVIRTTLADWQTATGQDGASIDADPMYVNPDGSALVGGLPGDLHVQMGSPIDSAGTLIASVTNDFDGEIRADYSPVDIGADAGIFVTVGACCLTTGCQQMSETSCTNAGGTSWSAGISCASADCPPVGACCLPTAGCAQLTNDGCLAQSGCWQGEGVSCTSGVSTFFTQNFDGVTAPALPSGWVATNASGVAPLWVTSNSGTPTPISDTSPNAAFVNDPATVSDKRLDSPTIAVNSGSSVLTFRNNYNLEASFDGGVLEISIAGGAFTDIVTAGGSFLSGGYNGPINNTFSNPIGGRQGWTGSSGGFITTTVNLPAAAARKNIILRWRMGSDNNTAGTGWRIDSISISNDPPVCPSNLTDPANVTACAGSMASFSIFANGANLMYQWRHNGDPLSNGGNISGANSATLVINPAGAKDLGSYDVVVSSGNCIRISNSVTYTPIVCNDNNPCTIDTCVSGACVFTPIVCNDSNPCTTDSCLDGVCVFTPIVCNDSNPCTTDTCVDGICVFTPIVCDDSNPCTTDTCVDGACVFTPIVCNDGNPCTIDTCVDGVCVFTPIVCNDSNPCTTDSCVDGACVFTPVVCPEPSDSCHYYQCVDGVCVEFATVPNLGQACSVGVGACESFGVIVCVDGVGVCSAVPGSPSVELCNGIDDDCDGIVDNNPTDASIWFQDFDDDGYGNASVSLTSCTQPAGYVADNTDCNDNDDTVHEPQTYYADVDGDGFGDLNNPVVACSSTPPAGSVSNSADCNDNQLQYADLDNDGFGAGDPVACGVANDTDCNDGDDSVHEPQTYYADVDGDGFGDLAAPITVCASTPPVGYVVNSSDCDDTQLLYADNDNDGFGFGPPVACGVANNTDCDDDDDQVFGRQIWYIDVDGDTYGDPNPDLSVVSCDQPFATSTGSQYVLDNTDCDDSNIDINPGAQEICNGGIDDDCDGLADDDDDSVIDQLTWYQDFDNDGYGSAASSLLACLQPAGYVADDTDCNDNDISVHELVTYYADVDGDGFGDLNNPVVACSTTPPLNTVANSADCDDAQLLYVDNDNDGFGTGDPVACGVANNTDCDDNDISVHELQTYYADVDNDGFGDFSNSTTVCSSTPPLGYVTDNSDCNDAQLQYADNDNDGYGAGLPVACGVANNTDCNDGNASINPGEREICNGLDDDCDNATDEGGICTPRLVLSGPSASNCLLGETAFSVTVSMADLGAFPAAGFQAFVHFDPTLFTFVSGTYTAAPFGLPIIHPIVATVDGDIDLASGINQFGGQSPTSADATLATLHFVTNQVSACGSGASPLAFRLHDPPSRITDSLGDPVSNLALIDADMVIVDAEGPVFDQTCPMPTIDVYADAGSGGGGGGGCGASASTVNPIAPTALDNCSGSATVIGTVDGNPLPASYPVGVTTIDWTATDACGNETVCQQAVNVSPDSIALIDVQLSPTVPVGITRCITFKFYNCTPPTLPPYIVNQMVTFGVGGLASDVNVLVPCAQGPFTCVTASDRKHTLRRTASLSIVDNKFDGALVGSSSLTGGNLNDDSWIDVLDFGIFTGQYNQSLPPATCSTTGPHADISGDGVVHAADFTFIQINFLKAADPICCAPPLGSGGGADMYASDGNNGGINLAGLGPNAPPDQHDRPRGPITRISVAELWARGLGQLTAADLTGDGWLDQFDMAAFLNGTQPPQLNVFNGTNGSGNVGGTGRWFDALNWGNGLVPDAQSNVVIASGSRVIIDQAGGGAVAHAVTALTGSTIRLTGSATLTANSVTINSGATLALDHPQALLAINNLILNPGSILIFKAGTIQVDGGNLLIAEGDLVIGDAADLAFPPATLRLLNGATASIEGDTYIAPNPFSRGRIELDASTFITHDLHIGIEGEAALLLINDAAITSELFNIGSRGDIQGNNGTINATMLQDARPAAPSSPAPSNPSPFADAEHNIKIICELVQSPGGGGNGGGHNQ